jgi:hypothetical protein
MRVAELVIALLCVVATAFATKALSSQELLEFGQESSLYLEQRLKEVAGDGMSLAASTGVAGVYGVDYSQAFSTTTLKCIKDKGYKFAIPRGYRSSGTVDPNVVNNVNNAWAAGFSNVDVYHFPCPKCGTSGSDQVLALTNHLKKYGVKVGMVWLDVEGTQYWGTQADNRKFFESMVAGARAAGVKIGVYTSSSQWGPLVGLDYTYGSSFPLWYVRALHGS